MSKTFRKVLLMILSALLLFSFAACKDEQAKPQQELIIETVKVLPKAYLGEEFDLWEVIVTEDGVKYSATACYTETILDPTTNEYSFQEHTLEVKDLIFTPVTLNDTIVTITAKRGSQTATKVISIGTTVRADPLDDLYKSIGILGWAETGISKSVCNDSRYVKGENSATSLHVKFDGTDPHEWGQMFMELSNETAQRYFTDQIWDNAIVTFWVYNPMEHDIEFQLSVNDHTFPVMVDWTGEEGHFRRQFAKAGEWTQIFFSLRRIGTTHKLVNNAYSTETLNIKMQYTKFSTTTAYQFDFYLDDLDVVPASTYPDIDCTYTASNETLEQGWENMPMDSFWQGASTIYDYENMMGEESSCSLQASFDSDKGPQNPFVALNPEMLIGSAQMPSLPDMTGGTLSAYFKFENASAQVEVDLIKQEGKEWKFSNKLPMQLTAVGDGWYKGTLDVYDFDFGTPKNDGILRIRFTFSGISKSSKVWMDTVKFDFVDRVKVRESADKDWINLPLDSGMTTAKVKFSTDRKKAKDSVRSMQITASGNQTAIVTVAPEYAVMEGTMKSLPNMTKGTVHAYFYFGKQEPQASMRLYNANWKYCKDVPFIFEDAGNGWYYGSIPASLFQGYPEGNSSKIIRISILIPGGYTVYVDGLMHYPNEEYATELNPDDVFASGIFTANDFVGDSGCEITTEVTNNSADAVHMWADIKTGWPSAGVSFASPVDISEYTHLSVDVKANHAHKWIAFKLGYLDANGTEQFSEIGVDFVQDDWQTVSVRLSQFAKADLTKVTKILVLVNMEDCFQDGGRNEFWLDNLKLTKSADEPTGRGQFFQAGENLYIELENADYASISFEYKLVTEGTMSLILRDGTWLKYFGDFVFDANGEILDYAGVTTEKLDDGYIRATMVMDELTRSGVADNRDNAPETIQIFDIYNTTTANGYVDNIQTVPDESEPDVPPEDPEDPTSRGQLFQAGQSLYIELENADYASISFEYKLITDGTMTLILRDNTWLKYFGDYIFTAEGTFSDYAGITTEKLDDGYIRVTMVMDELTRSGLMESRDNAPETINIFDVYSLTTADGYVDQVAGVLDTPVQPDDSFNPDDIFASGSLVTEGFVSATGAECIDNVLHIWGNNTTGWPVAGVSFTEPVDISAYTDISVNVKAQNAYKWFSIKIGYLNGDGIEQFAEVGYDFAQDDWQTVTMKLSQFTGMDLTKVTRFLICVNLETGFQIGACNEFWFDDLKVTKADTPDEPGGMELNFQAYTNAFLTFEEQACKAVQFDYKLEAAGEMYIILRDGTWLKYYGDYAFNADGESVDYAGITTEKLSNGYIRVTMILDELERTGCNNNRDIAPQTLAVFDVYGTTTVGGHIKNLQLLKEVPVRQVQKKLPNLLCWKPELTEYSEQETDAE